MPVVDILEKKREFFFKFTAHLDLEILFDFFEDFEVMIPVEHFFEEVEELDEDVREPDVVAVEVVVVVFEFGDQAHDLRGVPVEVVLVVDVFQDLG